MLDRIIANLSFKIIGFVSENITLATLKIFGVNKYNFEPDTDEYDLVIKKITQQKCFSLEYNYKMNVFGLTFGINFIAYLRPNGWIITHNKNYEELIQKEEQTDVVDERDRLMIVKKELHQFGARWTYTTKYTTYTPNSNQANLLLKIEEYFINKTEKRKVIILISGPPGCGKSTFADILASKLKCYLVPLFDPTIPGDTITSFTNYDKPVITCINEVDEIIKNFKNNMTVHKDFYSAVYDKKSWNNWLDNINKYYTSKIIIIMTTNKKIEELDAIDPSLFAPHRVNFRETFVPELN